MKKPFRLTIDCLCITILAFFDQFTKTLATNNLKDKQPFVVIKGVFELFYLENRGAAFGMLQNKQIVFMITASLMLLLILFTLYRMPNTKRYLLFEACLILIAAGAIGNMIDRAGQGFVVDFFYFVLINFPIFNVADIYVTVSCILLVILIIFVYKDNELSFLSLKDHRND